MRMSEYMNIADLNIIRDGNFDFLGMVGVSSDQKNQIVFVESQKFVDQMLKSSNVSCVITSEKFVDDMPEELGVGVSANPRIAFYRIHNHLAQNTNFYGSDFKSEISSTAQIHPTAFISEKNVTIGENCIIGPHVTVLEGTTLKNDVILRAGCVIGSEGFECKRNGKEILPIIHTGGVMIREGVEVQALTTVIKSVRGGYTEIGEYSKIDSHVHVGHAVKIGKRSLIAACVMIGGSTQIGDDVWIGPSAAISSSVKIGNGSSITFGSVVTKDVASGERVTGHFAIEHEKFISFIKSIS
jgi:UDP-3-O-[3-hydroxymyristoyl] glucosamine N-acyltransferase